MNNYIESPIKVLIELPTWLGDTVMATPAIENIINYYDNIEITIIGSFISVETIKNHPKVFRSIVVNKNYKNNFMVINKLEVFDIYFTFRGSIRSKILKLFVNAKNKYQFDKKKYKNFHQVIKYTSFINSSLSINLPAGDLIIHTNAAEKHKSSKLLGINPGASYGSAKRWYPIKFAEIAIELSDKFDIIIFGGANELDFAKEIEKILIEKNIKNYRNLAGKTSINELIGHIANLAILITGDSGPMHIAAGLKIPTISLFGPTNVRETSQWKNHKSVIIQKNLKCQPCMKRTCPLNHHNCMKKIEVQEVIDSIPMVYP